MKNKMPQLLLIFTAALAMAARYYSQWCVVGDSSCYGTWIHQIYLSFTSPLYFFALYSLPLATVLIFVSQETFIAWVTKVLWWALPLAVIHVVLVPVYPESGGYLGILAYVRDDAARVSAILFSLVSFGFILYRHFHSPKSI